MVSRKNATSASDRFSPSCRPTALSSSGVGSFALAMTLSFQRLDGAHCFFRRISSYGAAKYSSEFKPTAGSSSRGPTVQRGRLEDRRVHDALVHQLLDLVKDRLAPLPVALPLARGRPSAGSPLTPHPTRC